MGNSSTTNPIKSQTERRGADRPSVVAFGWLPWLAAVVVLIIVLGGYALAVRPAVQEFRKISAGGRSDALIALRSDVAQLESVRAAFDESAESAAEVIERAAPSDERIPELFVIVDAAAQRAGVIVSSIEVNRESPPTALAALGKNRVLAIGVTLRSVDYPRLGVFLDVLAASSRIVDALSVQFAPQSFTATVRLRAYSAE
ncbi:MAG: hypothetical protein V1723_02645 [Candidatus Uhrbacteria bacterium]